MIDHSMIQSCKFPDGALAGSAVAGVSPTIAVGAALVVCLIHVRTFFFQFSRCLAEGRGIRTPGSSRFNGFQDRRIRPLCHLRYGVVKSMAGREDSNPQQTVLETVALPIELPSYSGINPPAGRLLSPPPRAKSLLDDLGHLTGADRAATLADSEGQARLHGNRLAQLNRDGHVVTRHHHLGAFRQGQRTGHVSRTEVN